MNVYGEVFAGFYDRHFGAYTEKVAPLLLRFYASLSNDINRLPVLDLGCGTGRLALHFLDAGYSCVGLDQSPHMLILAESRCWHHVAQHKGRFLQEDISRFQIGGPFGMAVSTYNAMNHLESPEKMRSCFRAVRHCLAPGGRLIFDFHTLTGLREWATTESAQWENEWLECKGRFDGPKGVACLELKGEMGGRVFEEQIVNHAYPLEKITCWLREEGFQQADFFRLDDLESPLKEPERENRIVVVAG